MIINGLGFTQNPIYLSPTFFEGKDVSALIGEGIEAQHLNDDVHGRTLDAIYEYGTTSLLAELANEISQEFIPVTGRQNGHLDTSSLKVCGDYDVVTLALGEDRLKAIVAGQAHAWAPSDTAATAPLRLNVSLSPDRVYFFDPATEQVL